MADQLATPEDLAALLQKDLDEASAVLAVEVSTAVVQAAAGGQRILLVEGTEETVWGGPEMYLRLSQRPVVSVASVTYDGSALTAGTASGTYRLTSAGLWRDLGWTGCWADGPVATTVVYTHGYADGDQALQLARGAVLSLARGLFENPTGATQERIDDYAVAYAAAQAALDAQPGVKALLRRQYGRRAGLARVV